MLKRILNWINKIIWLEDDKKAWFKDFEHFKKTVKPVLNGEQKKLIQSYYKQFGYKVSTDWHDYYTSLTGLYSEKYIPADLMYTQIVPYLNYMPFELAYQDKNSYWRLLPNVIQPKCILQRVHSFFYDGNHIPITKERAVDICAHIDEVIIKPTIDSCQGHGVKLLKNIEKGVTEDGITIEDIFEKYGNDFIIQERVKQSDFLSSLNESSLNTMRILTFRKDNEIIVLSTAIRIGGKGSVTDNGYGGGFCCGILQDGTLKDIGYRLTTGERITQLQNGKDLKGLRIPHFNKVLEKAKELHLSLPYLRIIGWDFTLNKENEPVFIEMNTLPGLYIMQLNNGPVFGDYTDEVLKECASQRQFVQSKYFRVY